MKIMRRVEVYLDGKLAEQKDFPNTVDGDLYAERRDRELANSYPGIVHVKTFDVAVDAE